MHAYWPRNCLYALALALISISMSSCIPKSKTVIHSVDDSLSKDDYVVYHVYDPKTIPDDQPDLNTLLFESTFLILDNDEAIGTGFILHAPFQHPSKPNNVLNISMLVTAAHVLEKIKSDWATIYFRGIESGTKVLVKETVNIRIDGKPLWTRHPVEDVAVAPIGTTSSVSRSIPYISTNLLATNDKIMEFEIHPGYDVKILGFPFGLSSSNLKHPILRSGTLSSPPETATPYATDHLIDYKASFGDSGGPVYIHEKNWRKRGGSYRGNQEIQLIMGLITTFMFFPNNPNESSPMASSRDSMALAKYAPASAIHETIQESVTHLKAFDNGLFVFPIIAPFDVRTIAPNNNASQ